MEKEDQDIQTAAREEQVDKPAVPPAEAEEVDDEDFDPDHHHEDQEYPDDSLEVPEMAVDTVFVVFAQEGVGYGTVEVGDVVLEKDGSPVRLAPSRKASADDLYRYSMEIAKDIQVQETAAATVHNLAQQTVQIQQALQNQALADRIGQRGGNGLQVPGR